MDSYLFTKDDVSQHIVKYGVDVRPSILVKQETLKLQDYCNWLIENYPQIFESMLCGPNEIKTQKSFVTTKDKQIECATFVMSKRGPCYTFPVRMFVDEMEDFDLPDKDKVFRKSIEQFRNTFPDRKVLRVGVIHELVFDCGKINSVQVLASALNKGMWREGVANLRLHLEHPTEKYNVNIDLAPAIAQRIVQSPVGTQPENIGFGISVNVDINNRDMTQNVDEDTIAGILTFAEDYIPDKLLNFLNGE